MIKMRRIIAVWLVMLMVMGGIFGFVNLSTDAEVDNGAAERRSASQSKSGLTTHDPISINSNSDFASQASAEGWAGDGTEANPYIIENYDINASTACGIRIENTDVFFVIRNCVVHDGYDPSNYIYNHGIYFYNVTWGSINNVTSYNNHCGFRLWYSSNNNITNCVVQNNSNSGVYLADSSNDNIIKNCVIYNNSNGIYTYSASYQYCRCLYNQITECNVYNNGRGIYSRSSSDHRIINCTIYGNSYGIDLTCSSWSNIINCTISGNWQGIYLADPAYYNTIFTCKISNNTYGIYIYHASNLNQVTYCDFSKNDWGVYVQVYSPVGYPWGNNIYHNNFIENTHNAYDGASNYWDNGHEGNYWDDYNGLDNDINWIGDVQYNISGGSNKDRYPLMRHVGPPIAWFIYSPISPTTSDEIQFTNQSKDYDGYIANRTWDFDDGNISYEQNPTHKYADDGTYNVTLTVRDNDGAENSITKEIIVLNMAPIANFTFIPSVLTLPLTESNPIIFNSTLSSDSDGYIVSWLWQFGDGTNSTLQNLIHKYPKRGSYQVNLTVWDNDGASATYSTTITILNSQPILSNLTLTPKTGTEDTEFTFRITYSDADGDEPAYIKIVIDNVSYDMKKVEGDYVTGAVYEYKTKLSAGLHHYKSDCDDGSGTITSSATTDITSLTVTGKEEIKLLWFYIIIPVIIIIILAGVGLGIKRRKKGAMPPEKPAG